VYNHIVLPVLTQELLPLIEKEVNEVLTSPKLTLKSKLSIRDLKEVLRAINWKVIGQVFQSDLQFNTSAANDADSLSDSSSEEETPSVDQSF